MKNIIYLLIALFVVSCSKTPLATKTPTNPTTPTTNYVSKIPQNLDLEVICFQNIDSLKFTLYDSVAGNISLVMLDSFYSDPRNNPATNPDTFKYHISSGYRIELHIFSSSPTQSIMRIYNHSNNYMMVNEWSNSNYSTNFFKTLRF